MIKFMNTKRGTKDNSPIKVLHFCLLHQVALHVGIVIARSTCEWTTKIMLLTKLAGLKVNCLACELM